MSRVERALLSVSDKSGLVPFARALAELGVQIISTGGTLRALSEESVPTTPVSDITAFPEMLDGRVKTLHPAIHGGILADRSKREHLATLTAHGISTIDLVVVNLYPFVQTIARPGVSWEEAVENIDIGGPAMVRSAAKNHASVAVVVSPADYGPVLEQLRTIGEIDLGTRQHLAAKAFRHTADYDTAIALYLGG